MDEADRKLDQALRDFEAKIKSTIVPEMAKTENTDILAVILGCKTRLDTLLVERQMNPDQQQRFSSMLKSFGFENTSGNWYTEIIAEIIVAHRA